MKKILFLLLILVSCQKTDINKSINGTDWFASTEGSGFSEIYQNGEYIRSEYNIITDITLRFITESTGSVSTKSVATVDGVSEPPIRTDVDFTYTYDSDFMRGNIFYDLSVSPDLKNPLKSTFEIRSGFLYDDSELTGKVEYRRK